ncbi:octanoyltransferase, partial [Luminiphilus sp.]|nr:octanoyltransferase [Luminiphilus sp.]
VYVDGKKIAALGLKVSRGCSYHGVALNVDMDLEPFRRINPCGHVGLEVISMASLLGHEAVDKEAIGHALLDSLEHEFTGPTT